MSTRPLLDRLVRAAPIGLRFWDSVTNTYIGVGLKVSAYHPAAPSQCYDASTTVSNTYVLRGLPSLGNYEFENEDMSQWPPNRRYKLVIEVEDTMGRFLPFTCIVKVPTGGFANLDCTPDSGSPSTIVSTGHIPLFSAASRRVSEPIAALYTRLARLTTDVNTGLERIVPAAWALIEVMQGVTRLARGITDAEGSAALFFPYPAFGLVPPPDTPPPPGTPAVPAQRWPLTLRAFHTVSGEAASAPDLCKVLVGQTALQLWRTPVTEPLGAVTLEYGQELIVRSRKTGPPAEDLSILVVST